MVADQPGDLAITAAVGQVTGSEVGVNHSDSPALALGLVSSGEIEMRVSKRVAAGLVARYSYYWYPNTFRPREVGGGTFKAHVPSGLVYVSAKYDGGWFQHGPRFGLGLAWHIETPHTAAGLNDYVGPTAEIGYYANGIEGRTNFFGSVGLMAGGGLGSGEASLAFGWMLGVTFLPKSK